MRGGGLVSALNPLSSIRQHWFPWASMPGAARISPINRGATHTHTHSNHKYKKTLTVGSEWTSCRSVITADPKHGGGRVLVVVRVGSQRGTPVSFDQRCTASAGHGAIRGAPWQIWQFSLRLCFMRWGRGQCSVLLYHLFSGEVVPNCVLRFRF